MAQSKYTPQEYIKNAFKPQIAAVCSPNAAKTCSKNNLSFVEMIEPFCKLRSDAYYKDVSGQVITVHNLEITVLDLNYQSGQPNLAKKLLSASVSHATEPKFEKIVVNEYVLNIPTTAPWFEDWRDTFLQIQYPSDHEFTKHFLTCFYVVSSVDNLSETINEINNYLQVNQNEKSKQLTKWFFPETLKYYVILHDNFEGNNSNANKALEYLKETSGVSNCFLLRMNSRPPGIINEPLPDPWSQFLSSKIRYPRKNSFQNNFSVVPIKNCLPEKEINNLSYHPLSPEIDSISLNETLNDENLSFKSEIALSAHGSFLSPEDVEQIKLLIHEFCTRALIPHIERKINQLQQIFVNKSLTSSTFLSDPRKWFKSNKPSKNNSTNDVFVYKGDSQELLMRKLGDLCFMFGNYSGAMQAYSYCRSDFLRDGALFYYAGAVEMYILSAFMASEPPRKVFRDMEESVRIYLDSCKMPQFATRATLLIYECLKGHNLYGEAAHQLIRMTSEDSDLLSALLLEQAAYCFLNATPKLFRKYAFHMVLSGHRFSKALQKKHALRCYNQALQIFKKRGWNLAEDHIYFTIGKLAAALNLLEDASEVLSLLNVESKQSPEQQAIFFREFLDIRNALLKKEKKIRAVDLPIPLLDCDSIKVLVGPAPPLSIPGKIPALGITFSSCYDQETSQKWTKLEEMVVQEAQGSLPLLFKPLVSLYTNDNIGVSEAVAIIGEPIQISIKLANLLDITLFLKDIHLHWSFSGENTIEVSNSNLSTNPENYVKTFVMKSCTIHPKSTENLILSVVPFTVGKIWFKGVAFALSNFQSSEQGLTLQGEQKIFMKDKYNSKNSSKEIEIRIVPSAPCLQVCFHEMNTEIITDEVQEVPMEIKNVGNIKIENVFFAVSTPHLVSVAKFDKKPWISVENDLKTPIMKEKELRRLCVTKLPLKDGKLNPGQSDTFNLWIKAPSEKGTTNIDILIYYENTVNMVTPKYRLVRHTWKINAERVLSAKVLCQESFNSKTVEQLSLSTKVSNLTNCNSPKTVNVALSKMVLMSSNWLLLKDFIITKNSKINSEQSIYFLLKARRNKLNEESYSEIIIDNDSLLSNDVSLDFAFKNLEKHVNFLEEFFNFDFKRKLSNPNHLVLQWKAVVTENSHKRNVIGQLVVPLTFKEEFDNKTSVSYEVNQALDLTASISKSTISDETQKNQVLITLSHPVSVKHNFKSKKTCIVPVKVHLHNLVDLELTVTLNTMGNNRSNYFYHHPLKYFRWIGKSSAVKNLMPFCTEEVLMYVAVFGPGTYDLGARLEALCHEKEKSTDIMVLQNCNAESALIVSDTSS